MYTDIYQKKDNLVARKVGSEYIIVPIVNNVSDMNKVFTLNETGAFIWDSLNGVRTVSDIIELVNNEYNESKEIITGDVLDFIKKAKNVIIN